MCDMNCLNCTLEDCQNDRITDTERSAQNSYDRELKKERIPEERRTMHKGELVTYDYEQTDKRKAGKKRYIQSAKGKAAQKRYEQSEKGRERQRRYRAKKKAEREAAANEINNAK